MPALEFILSTTRHIFPENGGTARLATGAESGGEGFDQVMSRAISTSGAEETSDQSRSSMVTTTADEGKPNALPTRAQNGFPASDPAAQPATQGATTGKAAILVTPRTQATSGAEEASGPSRASAGASRMKTGPLSSPWQRKRLPTGNNSAAKVIRAADKTGGLVVQSAESASAAPVPEKEGAKTGDVAAVSSPAGNEPQTIANNWPGIVALVAGAFPSGVTPFISPAKVNISGPLGKAVATPPRPMANPTTAEDSTGAAEPLTQAKTNNVPGAMESTVEDSQDPRPAESAASPQPDGRQQNSVKTDDQTGEKINSDKDQATAVSGNEPPKGELPARDRTLLKAAAAPSVHAMVAEASPALDANMDAVTFAPLENDGTSVANQCMAMNTTEKTNKLAGLTGKTEKVLPGDGSLAVLGNNLPGTDPAARVAHFNESSLALGGLPANGADSVAVSGSNGAAPVALVDLNLRALERTHDMVALHALRLVDSKEDSLNVVIKPGAGLQMSLEMRQRGDSIDIRAVVQRGDFANLNQHWPELQQRLEQRGIRLAPLAGGENSSAGAGTNGFQQPQREFGGTDPLAASAFAAFALAGPAMSSTTAEPTPAILAHGWETWA